MNRWWRALSKFGSLFFAAAIIGIGIGTVAGMHSVAGGAAKIVPVIPWLPAAPLLAYPVGAIWIALGLGMLSENRRATSSYAAGALMVLSSLAFDVPRRPNVVDPEWRTNVLEPIAIGAMAWLSVAACPRRLHRVSAWLLGGSLIIFGVAHFQVVKFIAELVPVWLPGHLFWALFTGCAFVAAGVSFIIGALQRWAAFALGLMFAIFLLTIHLPPVIGYLRAPDALQDPDKWSDVLIVAALWGGAWMVTRPGEANPTQASR